MVISSVDIEDLIAETEQIPEYRDFSEEMASLIIGFPEIVLELLPYFFMNALNQSKSTALLRLILRCFDQMRYELDRNSSFVEVLLCDVQKLLQDLYTTQEQNIDKISKLNSLIYESKLRFVIDLAKNNQKCLDVPYDSTDTPFIELLETIRLDKHIRSSFDFYEALMSQMQVMPIGSRLEIIRQLTMTQKAVQHEAAVMMLLHPETDNRQAILELFLNLVNKRIFTPLDLRRLMVIRDWLPIVERENTDRLIQKIRLQGIHPYPYPVSKIDKIVASEFDGAGAQVIMLKLKYQSHHVVAGFVVKQGVGIRDPWIETKVEKDQFDTICQEVELYLKPVTLAYVNRAVSHFLAEGHERGHVPSPLLLQLMEIVGITEWRANRISIQEEINRLSQKINFNLKDKKEVENALARTQDWRFSKLFMRTWFECGEIPEMMLQGVVEEHENLSRMNHLPHLKNSLIEKLIVPSLEKWKVLMLFMCLWARSKDMEEPLWKDMLISLDQLVSGDTELEDIPIVQHIVGQTVAVVAKRQGMFF